MTTLVTGGTGFIGGNVVKALVARGEAVRALVRSTSKVDNLKALGVELCYGDVTDAESVAAAAKGCDPLYHIAAIYEWWLRDRSQFYRVNVEGTRNVLKAALEAGVQKVIYTSTVGTIGPRKGEVGTEKTQHRGYFFADYERSKYQAEVVAQEFAAQGLPVVCVNPAGVYGPGDTKQTAEMILAFLNGTLPAALDGRIPMVYIDDVVAGHLRAMDRGKPGERYILAGENTDFLSILRTVQGIAGPRKMPRLVPLWLAGIMAMGYEGVAAVTHKPPLISRDFIRMMSDGGFWVDNTKARQELGMTFLPLREGLERTLAWCQEAGLVRK